MSTGNLEHQLTRKEGEKIPLLIDCDPGIDDASALMVARASEKHLRSKESPQFQGILILKRPQRTLGCLRKFWSLKQS